MKCHRWWECAFYLPSDKQKGNFQPSLFTSHTPILLYPIHVWEFSYQFKPSRTRAAWLAICESPLQVIVFFCRWVVGSDSWGVPNSYKEGVDCLARPLRGEVATLLCCRITAHGVYGHSPTTQVGVGSSDALNQPSPGSPSNGEKWRRPDTARRATKASPSKDEVAPSLNVRIGPGIATVPCTWP